MVISDGVASVPLVVEALPCDVRLTFAKVAVPATTAGLPVDVKVSRSIAAEAAFSISSLPSTKRASTSVRLVLALIASRVVARASCNDTPADAVATVNA